MVQAAIAAIPAIMQFMQGIKQQGQADELGQIQRPTRTVPPAVQEMINRSRILAGQTKAPGADILENKLLSTSAAGVNDIKNTASSSSSALSAITNLYGNQMGGLNDLSIRNQDYSQQMMEQLLGNLNVLGGEQNKNFDYNFADPYDNAKKAESALRYGADKNKYNAVNNLAGNATGAIDTGDLMSQLTALLGTQ